MEVCKKLKVKNEEKELLKELSLDWQESSLKVETDIEKELSFEKANMCSIKQNIKTEGQVQDQKEAATFRSITDYILNKPLKPLPSALQKIIPSILSSVIVKAGLSDSYKPETPNKRKTPLKPRKIPDSTTKPFTCFSSLPPYKCKLCNFRTFLKIHLAKHIKIPHRRMKILSSDETHQFRKPKLYSCVECNFTSFSKLVLLKHVSATKSYSKCASCGYTSESKSNMKKHLRIKHRFKRKLGTFQCDHCDYFNRMERNLRRHLINMHSYKDNDFFHCNYCNYKTVHLGVLKKHEEVRHGKKKVYRFSCGKTCSKVVYV